MKMTQAFSENLRTKRKERGLTQERLARAARISYNFISQLERGMKAPTLRTVEKLAEAMSIDPLDLLQHPRGVSDLDQKLVRTIRRIHKSQLPLAQKVLEVFARYSGK